MVAWQFGKQVEGPRGPKFVELSPLDRPYAGEDYLIVPTLPGDDDEAAAQQHLNKPRWPQALSLFSLKVGNG